MSGRVPTEEGELGCAELAWSPRQLKPEAADPGPKMGARLHGTEKASSPTHSHPTNTPKCLELGLGPGVHEEEERKIPGGWGR